MAKIEMDISEYDEMRENKRLLEASLANERKLHEQIDTLLKEKNQALEEAKMKVTKITKSEVTEYLYLKKDIHEFLPNLGFLLSIPYHLLSEKVNVNNLDKFIDIFFDKTKSYSCPTEEITTHGLDEIKKEIREDIESKIDKDIVEKLNYLEKLSEKNKLLVNDNDDLKVELDIMKERNTNLTQEIDNLNSIIETNNSNDNKLDIIKDILKDDITIWNKGDILRKLKAVIR